MARTNRFVILLTDREKQAIDALAKTEKLAPSTFARRRLLFDAEQRGIIALPEMHNRADSVLADASAVVA